MAMGKSVTIPKYRDVEHKKYAPAHLTVFILE